MPAGAPPKDYVQERPPLNTLHRLFSTPVHSLPGDLALLLLRGVAGAAFVLHGWDKIRDPFGWAGPDSSFPGLLLALAALSEFGGGLAWVAGLLTPLASFGIACTMVVAFSLHAFVLGDPFVAQGPGQGASEPAAVYLCVAVLLAVLGPGRVSLDRALFGPRRR